MQSFLREFVNTTNGICFYFHIGIKKLKMNLLMFVISFNNWPANYFWLYLVVPIYLPWQIIYAWGINNLWYICTTKAITDIHNCLLTTNYIGPFCPMYLGHTDMIETMMTTIRVALAVQNCFLVI